MAKRLILLTLVSLFVGGLDAVLYDCVSGKPANRTQLKIYEQRNNTGVCTVDVKPCDPEEWRRIDGSCNNLRLPSRGTHRTPTARLLPIDFSPNYEPRKAADGGELESPRRVRTEMMRTGKASDLRVTQLAAYYILFSSGDINSIHDILNYIKNITTCCKPESRNDYRCTPIKVPVDDPVHRFSGINCMNLTRPQSFQTYGCLDNGTEFSRIVFQTPVYDLSNTYNLNPGVNDRLRTFKNGLLQMEEDNGLLFPPSDPQSDLCFMNQRPREIRCHKYLCYHHTSFCVSIKLNNLLNGANIIGTGIQNFNSDSIQMYRTADSFFAIIYSGPMEKMVQFDDANNALGTNLINILFYRQHNKIAEELLKLNPTWNDERLFFTSRDINIAISLQIFLYELLTIFLGKLNMIRDGIISCDGGFRDLYDESVPPQTTDEFVYAHRWFHTIQETTMKLYDKDGCFLKTFPMANATARTGYFPIGNNMVEFTQGTFRQPGGRFDYTIDTDMGDRVLGPALLAADVGASDLAKGRLFGFPPYIKYKEFCTKRSYKKFSDLKDHFDPERLYSLIQNHKCLSDVDLLSGMWAEKHVKGGKVPETLYCVFVEQLRRTIASDRHWYERPNRPNAFTEEQLQAIRKTTIAGILCWVGDDVTEIQPRAFRSITSKNPLMKCDSPGIGKLDLSAWKESKSCKN